MQRAKQISESIELGAILALAGGFMDAYSYIGRGGVFANAQTGNMLLAAVNLSSGDPHSSLKPLLPVIAFALGIMMADLVHERFASVLQCRQYTVLSESVIVIVVSRLPESQNLLANCLTSLACGTQVESFRKIHGHGIATTMCIGNLRSGTDALSVYAREHKPEQLRQALYYFGVIFMFAIGDGIGGNLSAWYGIRVIWVSCILLAVSYSLMEIDKWK